MLLILTITSCNVFLGPEPDKSPKGIFDQIWNDVNETYALFRVKGIDWDAVYHKYSPLVTQNMADYNLFIVCGNMMNELNDLHSFLRSPFGVSLYLYEDETDYGKPDYAFPSPPVLTDDGIYTGDGTGSYFYYGTFRDKPNVGYLYINDFLGFNISLDVIPDWAKEIDGIVKYLLDTDALVIDIRNNGGGMGSNVDYIASRFISQTYNYAVSRTKNGPGPNDFTDPVTWTIVPAGVRYTKRIILLTNRETPSAAEWFTLALRNQSHVIHMGEKTAGGMSARIVRPLINGWAYTLSVQEVQAGDGNFYDGVGIPPHVELLGDYINWKKVLDYALGVIFPPDMGS